MRRRLRQDRAATDPLLVIAAIAVSLVLLVGGSFTVGGVVSQAKHLNAQNDLNLLAVAEASALANGYGYQPFDSQGEKYLQETADTSFTLSDGGYMAAAVCPAGTGNGWWAAARAADGTVWVRTSETNQAFQTPAAGITLPSCVTLNWASDLVADVSVWTSATAHLNALTAIAGVSPTVDVADPAAGNHYAFDSTMNATTFIVSPNWAYHWYGLDDTSGNVSSLLTTFYSGYSNTVGLNDNGSGFTSDGSALSGADTLSVFGETYSGGRPTNLIDERFRSDRKCSHAHSGVKFSRIRRMGSIRSGGVPDRAHPRPKQQCPRVPPQ